MTPEQWRIHQEQQRLMPDFLLAAKAVPRYVREQAVQEFTRLDTLS